MIARFWTVLVCGYPDVVGSQIPHWTEERLRAAEQETEHYLSGTVTAPRVKPMVRDQAAIDAREARLLEMAQAEIQPRRRVR